MPLNTNLRLYMNGQSQYHGNPAVLVQAYEQAAMNGNQLAGIQLMQSGIYYSVVNSRWEWDGNKTGGLRTGGQTETKWEKDMFAAPKKTTKNTVTPDTGTSPGTQSSNHYFQPGKHPFVPTKLNTVPTRPKMKCSGLDTCHVVMPPKPQLHPVYKEFVVSPDEQLGMALSVAILVYLLWFFFK